MSWNPDGIMEARIILLARSEGGDGSLVCDEQKATFCGSFDTIRKKRKTYAEV
jgi:hypothetical protein